MKFIKLKKKWGQTNEDVICVESKDQDRKQNIRIFNIKKHDDDVKMTLYNNTWNYWWNDS